MSADTQAQAEAKPKLPEVVITYAAMLFGCPVNKLVCFYPNGDREADPVPALVVLNHGNGQLKLIALRGQMGDTKNALRHIDDPFFKDHQNVLKRDGAWDYGPGDAPFDEDFKPLVVEAFVPEVVKHWNNNVRMGGIAQRIRGMVTIAGQPVAEPLTLVQYALGKFVPAARKSLRK